MKTFLFSFCIVCTMHVMYADDALVLSFTEGLLVCAPGLSGTVQWCS